MTQIEIQTKAPRVVEIHRVGVQGGKGDPVSLQKNATHIQWRTGTNEWLNLVALTDIRGIDGGTTSFRATSTHLQWRLDDGPWQDLVPLENLKGQDAEEISIDKTDTHIRWRRGSGEWENIISIEELDGEDGIDAKNINLQVTGTHIQWALGDGDWVDLLALSDIAGSDGLSVEIRNSGTHIQWSYVGENDWNNIIDLAELNGSDGLNSWTPVFSVVSDGERRVLQIIDWTGGEAAKPTTGLYIGSDGLKADIAEGVNVRGSSGAGAGDMLSSVYDPTNKSADAFNQDNMTDGSVNKNFSASEKTKLAGISSGATVNDTDANLKNRANHTGTQSADTITDGVSNKVYSAAEQSKLAGLESGATANDTDANLKNRSNHTGTQAQSTIIDLEDDLALLAPKASPAFTGNPTAPTQSAGNASTRIATTAYVDSAVSALIDGAPGAIDTLNELAAALGDDPNFATTVMNAVNARLEASENLADLDDVSEALVNLGFDPAIVAATTAAFTTTLKSKLDAVAAGATANDTDANLKNRANHTGTQTASTISDFAASADARVGPAINAATSKATPVDADVIGILDSAASFVLKKFTWANIKAALKTYFDSVATTLTNKRITPRVGTVGSSSSLTIDSDSFDVYIVTALAAAITMNAPSGTPTDGQKLLMRFKDNGTARAFTSWNAIFRAIGVTLPTTTVPGKTLYVLAVWNVADSKWDVLAVGQEA